MPDDSQPVATPPRRWHARCVSRLYDPEPPITVEVDNDGRPSVVTWQRREAAQKVVNRWRIDDDWWRVPISRTYYTVRTPTALLEVYHDDRVGDWYLRRLID